MTDMPAAALALLLSVGMLASCGPRINGGPHESEPSTEPISTAHTPSDTMEQLRGKLFVTGSEPMTTLTLQREDGSCVTLVGELTDELHRLSGAEVAVYGTRMSGRPAGALAVQRYDVLSIDGQRPSVGILLVQDDAVWLAAADTVALAAVPDALRTQAGAKVWVVGRHTDRGVEVQSYGVLRPAPE